MQAQAAQPSAQPNTLQQVMHQVGNELIHLASQTQNQILIVLAGFPDESKIDPEDACDKIEAEVGEVLSKRYLEIENELLGQVAQNDLLVVKQELTKVKQGVDGAVATMHANHRERIIRMVNW